MGLVSGTNSVEVKEAAGEDLDRAERGMPASAGSNSFAPYTTVFLRHKGNGHHKGGCKEVSHRTVQEVQALLANPDSGKKVVHGVAG